MDQLILWVNRRVSESRFKGSIYQFFFLNLRCEQWDTSHPITRDRSIKRNQKQIVIQSVSFTPGNIIILQYPQGTGSRIHLWGYQNPRILKSHSGPPYLHVPHPKNKLAKSIFIEKKMWTCSVQTCVDHIYMCWCVKEGNGNPLQYSCLENLMDGGAWWAAVHGVLKSQTQLSDFTFTFHFHALEKEMAAPVFLPGQSQGQWRLVDCCL